MHRDSETSATTRKRGLVLHGRARALVALAAGLVVAASIAIPLVVSQLNAEPSQPSSTRSGLPAASGGTTTVHLTAKPAVRVGGPQPERPVVIVLPSHARVPIEAARTLADGSLGVPRNIAHAGWWTGGSRIGDRFGAMVIGAHVDSTIQGLGPFAEFLDSRRGDRLSVRSDRLSQTFAVTDVALVPKSKPAEVAAQFSGRGPGRLVLITCAGPYIRSQGGYQNIVVITARPTASPVKR